MEALYHREADCYTPTDAAGSPWHPSLLHGGAVSGLLMRHGLEQLAQWPGFRISRITMDLVRPAPKAPLDLSTELVRDGGKLKLLQLEVRAAGKLIAQARLLAQKPRPMPLPEYAPRPAGSPRGPDGVAEEGIQQMLDAKGLNIPEGFHSRVRLRPLTPFDERGQGTCWVHMPVQVVSGEDPDPLAHLGMVADLGNGVGQLNYGNATGTINADISLHLFRQPVSLWLCLESQAQVQPDGMGVVHTRLYDTDGAIGYILQTVQPNGEYQGD